MKGREKERMYMSEREQRKLQIIVKLTQNKLSRWQAQKILGVSETTVRRYLRAYEKKGLMFVKHGNFGRIPKNKTSQGLKDRVETLVREKYFDFNITHLQEKLEKVEGIRLSRFTLGKWMNEWKMVKRKRKRRREYKARFQRDRLPQRGLMLQFDGSHHRWFADKVSCLIAAIDDATNEIPYAEFFTSEDTQNCMKVVQEILKRYGLFHVLYVDRAGVYGGPKRPEFSQMQRACEELGIHFIYAESPQGKGRVERLFGTLQDRLVAEMRLKGIQTLEEANRFLHEEFLPNHYTPKFTQPPEDPESAYRPLPPNVDLTDHFCFKEWRQITNDHTVTWHGWRFVIDEPLSHSIVNHYLEFRRHPDKLVEVFYNQKPIQLKMIKRGVQNLRLSVDYKKSKSLGIKTANFPIF